MPWTTSNHLLIGDPTLRYRYTRTSPDPGLDFTTNFKLEVWMRDDGSNTQRSAFRIFVKNKGTSAFALSGLKARFYLSTREYGSLEPVLEDYYTPSSAPTLVNEAPSMPDLGRYYVEFDFGQTNGVLGPGASTSYGVGGGETVAVHYPDWAPWGEFNDYSTVGKSSNWAVTRYVHLYRNGVFIYGNAR
jgi:hypothetical protein